MDFTFLVSLLLQSLLISILTHFIIFTLLKRRTNYKLPPGPFPLPLIGNLHHCLVGKMPHRTLSEIAKRHGDLVCLQLGSLTTVVVSSAARAEEVTHKYDTLLAYRQVRESSTACDRHLRSVIFLPPGPRWRFLRKIATSHLFSNSRLDAGRPLRQKKLTDLLHFAQQRSKTCTPINISQAAFSTSLNILSNTFFSFDLTSLESDTETTTTTTTTGHELKDLFTEIIALGGTPNIADLFPVLKPFDPQRIKRRSKVLKERIMELFDGIIDERIESRKENCRTSDNDDDVLDVLLDIHEEEENGGEFEIRDIRIFLFDLFVAGTDTTSSTIEWAMAELIRNRDKMLKAQAELDRVIGKANPIDDTDVPNLPYLKAVVKETLRLHPAVPLLVPRKASAAVEVSGGFVIPKDAQIWVNVWAMGRDESVWKDAELFQPERFLDLECEKIDYGGRNYEFIPFGSGRRVCLGMTFASRVLHLVLGSLISCFDWKVMEGEVEMDERFGLSLQKAKAVCVVPVCRGGGDDMKWRQRVLFS